MSGLGSKVTLEAKKGKIIISKNSNTREGWDLQIKSLASKHKGSAKDFEDMTRASNDGLDELEWDGPSFEDWQKEHDRLS